MTRSRSDCRQRKRRYAGHGQRDGNFRRRKGDPLLGEIRLRKLERTAASDTWSLTHQRIARAIHGGLDTKQIRRARACLLRCQARLVDAAVDSERIESRTYAGQTGMIRGA